MTIQEIVTDYGDWTVSALIRCAVKNCPEQATDYVLFDQYTVKHFCSVHIEEFMDAYNVKRGWIKTKE